MFHENTFKQCLKSLRSTHVLISIDDNAKRNVIHPRKMSDL